MSTKIRLAIILGVIFLILGGCELMVANQHRQEEQRQCELLHTYGLRCVDDMS